MMKNRQLHTIILPLCTLLLFSCTQDTISPAPDSENEIRFQTGTLTRGLIDNLAVGSEICLYGYRDGTPLAQGSNLADGTSKALEGKTLAYRNFNGADRWSVVNGDNPITYFWEGTGTYRFFGWLQQDANGLKDPDHDNVGTNDDKWSAVYNESKKKLTVNATLDKDYNQFDFLYSNVDERTLPRQSKSDPVALEMNHLFTAFGIGISNTSKNAITVKSVTLGKLHDKGSAVIDFSTTPCAVSYGTTSISRNPDTAPFIEYGGSGYTYTIESGDGENTGVRYNIFNPSATAKEYYMVWPQAESVFPELTFASDEAEATEPDTSFPLILVYESNGTEYKKRMQLPKMAWEPGKLYYFNVLVADKLVEITATVKDWNYSHADVDLGESALSVKQGKHLIWDENTCTVDHTNRIVYVKNGQPVEGTFTIDAPKGGQWRVSLEGDFTAFTIMDDAAPTDDGFGPIDGKQHRIRIVPQISNPDRDYSVTLKFVAVAVDSKTYSADELLQDYDNDEMAEKYTVVLECVN